MFDDEIDNAARELTDAQPRADFAIRVMARIAAGRARRQGAVNWRWMLAPIAAAAIVAVAIVLGRGWRTQAPQPSQVAKITAEHPVAVVQPPPSPARSVGPTPGAARHASVTVSRAPVASPADQDFPGIESIRLVPVDMEPIDVGSIPPLSTIEPPTIAMPALELPAMSSGPASPIS